MKNIKCNMRRAYVITMQGLLYYYYDFEKTNILELLKIESLAHFQAIKKHQPLFNVYKTNAIGFVALGLN